ncbi:MAG: hypothetical protein LBU06_00955 [Desulfovibrio sp.]|jgi:AsmA protein|nr:hypothetical protein [Desulfovibrio sp.]
MTTGISIPSRPRSPLRRFIFWLLLLPLLLAVSLLGSLYILCVSKPDLVIATLEKHVSAVAGVPLRIRGGVRPILAPFPGIEALDVLIPADYGAEVPAEAPSDPPAEVPVEAPGDPPAGVSADASSDPPAGVSVDASSDPPTEVSADAPAVVPEKNLSPLAEFEAVRFFFDPTGLTAFEPRLGVSGRMSLPAADLRLDFSLTAAPNRGKVLVRGSFGATLNMTPPASRSIAAVVSGDFAWVRGENVLELPGFVLHAEGDELRADLKIDLEALECTGKVKLERLSLTRWFEFGRALTPGLRAALHGMSGEFDLLFNKGKVEAHNLTARAGALSLTGYVGAPDLDNPAVVVHAQLLGRPDLDQVFPFLGVAGRDIPEPVPPVFDHPPLAPYPEAPDAPSSASSEGTSVGYDINIRAEEAIIHGVAGGPLEVRVHPHLDANGADKTRVSIKAGGMLNGAADGFLDIDASGILMRYETHGMELGLLPENEGGDTRISGLASGVCEIDMPFLEDGSVADDWPMRADIRVKDFTVTGKFHGRPWKLFSPTATGAGEASIHAVLEDGVRIDGMWRLEAAALHAPWQSRGDGAIRGTFSGGLVWPGIMPGPRTEERRYGVERVKGKAALRVETTIPLPGQDAPLKGALDADLDWEVRKEKLLFPKAAFEGQGSYAEGAVSLDFSGSATVVHAQTIFRINPRELLSAWKMQPPGGIGVPKLFSGKADIYRDANLLRLDKIKVEADSAPISGNITYRRAPDAASLVRPDAKGDGAAQNIWTARLNAEFLDLDNVFPENPPASGGKAGQNDKKASRPWDLGFMKDLSLDIQLSARNARRSKLTASEVQLTARLQKDRFSLYCGTEKFYGGAGNVSLQGTIFPEKGRVTLRKGTLQLNRTALGRLLYDYTGEQSYAGEASLSVEANGVFERGADLPAKLSGSWNMAIKDGQYPAFLSGPDSKLRNTFSLASASGPLDRGVIRADNFTLSGPMVDMKGGGWFDLNTKDMDMEISVTFAKVPTVPVRFHGNASAPRMNIRGAVMMVETVQAAGSGIFDLIYGVLTLPAKALSGIGSLFEKGELPGAQPQSAPPKENVTRRPPGQPPGTMEIRPPSRR